ncbi:hypothetical protein, partial [Mesorhizobium sp. M7A.F.Ca.MR.362.00.0.0]|uniref:hypothetical protein n=1 Tax=Mesorhizobium sp. M7A.F.Ca.MR.362.00.0.0 TaxID=2496779 RepID=UPI001FE13F1F
GHRRDMRTCRAGAVTVRVSDEPAKKDSERWQQKLGRDDRGIAIQLNNRSDIPRQRPIGRSSGEIEDTEQSFAAA